MKKIIAGLMALVFLCSSTAAVFAAYEEDNTDLKAGDEYKDGIQEGPIEEVVYADAAGSVYYSDISDYSVVGILGALNIMGAAEGTQFKPNMYVSRAQFAEGVLKLMNIDYSDASGLVTGEFYDVDESSEYYNIVYHALAADLISGYGNNSFRPESVMSYAEAQICLVRALGYTDEFESYLKISSELKLTDKVHVKNSMAITRMEMAQLLYNALETPSCERVLKDGSMSYTMTGKTILYNVWNAHRSQGLVTTSFRESIGSMSATENTVVINDTRYHTDSESDQFFIGYDVKYYYDEDNNLIYMYKSNKVDEIVIDSDDWLGLSGDRTASYEVNGRRKNEKLELGYKVLYNGMVPTESYTDAELFDVAEGQIRLISNDSGSTYNIIMIDEYRDYVLKSAKVTGSKIDLLLDNGRIEIDLSNTYLTVFDVNQVQQSVYRITSTGEETIDISALKSDSVISVYAEYGKFTNGLPNTGSKYMKIVVSDKKVTGTITGSNIDEYILRIDDEEYKAATYGDGSPKYTYLNISLQQAGATLSYYADFRNKLVDVASAGESTDTGDWQYAYLARAYYNEDDECMDKIIVFTNTEEMKTFKASENLRINGVKIKPHLVISKLQESADKLERIIGSVNISLDCAQPIKMKVDEDNTITDIELFVEEANREQEGYDKSHFTRATISTTSSGNTFAVDQDGNGVIHYQSSYNGVPGSQGLYRTPALIMKVPITDSSDPSDYAIETLSGKTSLILDLYDVTNQRPALAIRYADEASAKKITNGYNNTSYVAMLGAKSMGVDEDNNRIMKFTVVNPTGPKEYYTSDAETINTLNRLEKGSLISLYGAGDEITSITYVSYNGKPLGPSNLPWDAIKTGDVAFSASGVSTTDYLAYECYSVYSSTQFGMQNGALTSDAVKRENLALGFTRNNEWQSGGFLLYSEEDGEISVMKGTPDMLRGADNYGLDKCSIIFAMQHVGGARQYIAYNFSSNKAQKNLNSN
ncbi:MAG: S-layer homology domain-containing protein [Clostridiales bacterium]|nr:S-layer homology domain-containing protein [Clostridiales bacterium]